MGSGEEECFPSFRDPVWWSFCNLQHLVSKINIVTFSVWWLEENSFMGQVWEVLRVGALEVTPITSAHTLLTRTQVCGIARCKGGLESSSWLYNVFCHNSGPWRGNTFWGTVNCHCHIAEVKGRLFWLDPLKGFISLSSPTGVTKVIIWCQDNLGSDGQQQPHWGSWLTCVCYLTNFC